MGDIHLHLGDHPDFDTARTIALRLSAAWGVSSDRQSVISGEVTEAMRWIGDDLERLGLLLWWISTISGVAVRLLADEMSVDAPDVLAVIERTLEAHFDAPPDEP